jgi:hypothetical protein
MFGGQREHSTWEMWVGRKKDRQKNHDFPGLKIVFQGNAHCSQQMQHPWKDLMCVWPWPTTTNNNKNNNRRHNAHVLLLACCISSLQTQIWLLCVQKKTDAKEHQKFISNSRRNRSTKILTSLLKVYTQWKFNFSQSTWHKRMFS